MDGDCRQNITAPPELAPPGRSRIWDSSVGYVMRPEEFLSVSSRVLPVVMHPGRSGT